MNRQEREEAKNIEQNMKIALKSASKNLKWKYKDSVIFKVQEGLFFECMISYNRLSKDFSARLAFKPVALDNLFWEVFDMPENMDQPLSFRTFGAFTVTPFKVQEWKEEVIGSLEQMCRLIIEKCQNCISTILLDVKDISTYVDYLTKSFNEYKIKHTESILNINLELILSNILLGNIKNALSLITERLQSGDTGKFVDCRNNTLKGIYEYAKEYCIKCY